MGAESYNGEPEDEQTGLRGIAFSILVIFPVILLIVGSWNLFLAHEMGGQLGYSLSALFHEWREGLDITGQYSHTYLIATKRFSNALWQLSASITTLVAAIVLVYKNMVGKKK